MKDKNKNQENFKSSALDELPDEILMAYIDGELIDSNIKKIIEGSSVLKERAAVFISTRQLLKPLKTDILNTPPPKSMTDLVKEEIAAQEQKRLLLNDLEIMATVDGEAGFGVEIVDSSDNNSEKTKIFSWTSEQFHRLRTGVLQEPTSENMLRFVEEELKKKETQEAQASIFKTLKPVSWFSDRIASWWSQLVPDLMLDYRVIGVAMTGILAVGLYITTPFENQEPWEARFSELGLEQNFVTNNWISNADNVFVNFNLPRNLGLIMRGTETPATDSATLLISELEEVLDQMVDGMNTRALLELPNEQIKSVFLRTITVTVQYPGILASIDETVANENNLAIPQPQNVTLHDCIVGELVDGEVTNPELVVEGRFFSFCPSTINNRLTFL